MTPGLKDLPRRDIERLSAYLDGELQVKEAERLEARLRQHPQLRQALQELQQTSSLLASLPPARVPRSFALSADMVGQQERGWSYPVMQLATAFAAFAFLLVIGFDALTSGNLPFSFRQQRMAAEAPAAQEAPAEALLEAADQLEMAEAPADESRMNLTQPSESARVDDTTPSEPMAEEEAMEEEAMEAEIQGTPLPEEGLAEAAPTMQGQALGEQDQAVAPTPSPSLAPPLEPLPTAAATFSDQTPESGGMVRLWLRWLEIGLAAIVIVLAVATFRLRSH